MKWYNEDKTKMIDLDAVNGYVYVNAKEYVDKNPSEENVNDFKLHGDKIELVIGGSVFVFRGEQATELFFLLKESVRSIL